MTGPYKDLRVVELGRFIAAPYCGQLFADGGADVIKVEPVTGGDARRNGTRLSSTEARQFLNKNRGKRSLAVNLADNRALSAVQTLLHEADVAITNFRPGQAKRLGLDYASIRATNPRIVYAENSAFGPKGPLAGKPGMDILLQAYAGIAPLSESGPAVFGDPIVDYTAAMLMAWGIATALYNRERTGEGQQLDVSLLQAALVIQNNSVNHIDAVDGWRTEFCDYLTEAFGRGATMGEILAQRETLKPTINPPYYGFFQTSDGYIAIAAGGRGLQVRVAQLLGVNDPTLTDDDYQPADIAAHTAAMRAQTAAVVIEHPTELWLAKFDEAGLPAGRLQLKDQVLDDPQAWANDYLVRLEHPEVGGMIVVAPPVKFGRTPLSVTTPTPRLGEHSRQILLETGLSDKEIDALVADRVVTTI
jgi:crotonobetainyl-CoA:carnitine CoA-transferase CaiB-like acyl-CoA transferase